MTEAQLQEWEVVLQEWEGRIRRRRRQDRAILLSWGLAVLMLAGLFSFWLWHVQREKDRAMCTMLDLSMAGVTDEAKLTPEQRRVLAAMRDYQATLSCGDFRR